MRKTSLFKTSIASLLAIILFSCGQKEFKKDLPKISLKFDTNSLIGSENDVIKKVRYDTPQCSDNKCSELRYFHATICVG
jgi:hypothetical protein